MLAHSKGKSLGLYHDSPETAEEKAARMERDKNMGVEHVDAFGMSIPVRKKGRHRLAFSQGSTLSPAPVKSYLSHAFKDHLEDGKVRGPGLVLCPGHGLPLPSMGHAEIAF